MRLGAPTHRPERCARRTLASGSLGNLMTTANHMLTVSTGAEVPLQRSLRSLALAATALMLGACSTFQPKSAVEMKTADVNLNSSWHARIASPAELAGAVQMSGSASMAPGVKRGTTEIVVRLGNTSPGGVHPWAIHLGQCGQDEGVFGALDNYAPLRVGSDGTGVSSATVSINT